MTNNPSLFISVLILTILATFIAVDEANSQAFTAEISPGAAGFDTIDSFGLGVAGTIYLPLESDAVALGLRPELAWHNLEFGHDLFFTGNVQLDVKASESVTPSLWVGGGLNRYAHSGLTLAQFTSQNPPPSEGAIQRFLLSGRGGDDATGAVVNLGTQVRINVTDIFYVAPGFTYTRGFGDVEGNSYRVGLALGAGF